MVILLTLVAVTAAQSTDERNMTAEVEGLRALMKQGKRAGFFATCRLVLFSEQVDYDTAEEGCKTFDIGMGPGSKGNLATVNIEAKNSDVKELLKMAYPGPNARWGPKEWAWIGLRKMRNNNATKYKYRKWNAEDWEWDNKERPVNFNKWMRGQPDQAIRSLGDEDCTANYTRSAAEPRCYQNQARVNHWGRWDDTFKFKKHSYACDYNGKYLIANLRRNWTEAKNMCRAAGLQMAKVTTLAEHLEIVAAAEYFLGPKKNGTRFWANENWFWIGLNDLSQEGNFTWSDGENFDHSADWIEWKGPQPDNSLNHGLGGQDAVAISKWGDWDDSFSWKRKRPFACQCPDAVENYN